VGHLSRIGLTTHLSAAWLLVGSADMNPIWNVVHAERDALMQDMDTLTPEQWFAPSLCPDWTVHDVLAHLVDDAKTTRLGFVARFVVARFDFDRCNQLGVDRERSGDPRHTLNEFPSVSGRTTSAPAPLVTRLVEAFVHGEDIRRPLGISRVYPVDDVATALRYHLATSVNRGGGKERAEGLRLVSTDSDLESGAGKDVHGTTLALLLAVSGRPVAPDELAGPGAAGLVQQ
jgi:uncharacterized protein (TIGR03083 family)